MLTGTPLAEVCHDYLEDVADEDDLLEDGVPDFRHARWQRRMSQAAKRKTTRVKNEAHRLLAIFDISIQTLYRERRQAAPAAASAGTAPSDPSSSLYFQLSEKVRAFHSMCNSALILAPESRKKCI